jgi:hypothetical protein
MPQDRIYVGVKIHEVLTTGEVYLEFLKSGRLQGMEDHFDEILVFDTDGKVYGYNIATSRCFTVEDFIKIKSENENGA